MERNIVAMHDTCYIVTEINTWSDDERIVGVFTSLEKAEDFVNAQPASNKRYTIEVYKLQ